MAGPPRPPRPESFVNADRTEAAGLVAAVVRRIRPAVVVTYDEQGGYGHPDHVQTHRVTCAAVLSLPEGERPALYAVLTPASWARQDREWLAEHLPFGTGWSLPDPDGEYPPSVVADELVTHEVVDEALVAAQAEALRHHATQVTVAESGSTYALSNDVAARLPGREGFALLDPATGRLATVGADRRPAAGGGTAATTRHKGLSGLAALGLSGGRR